MGERPESRQSSGTLAGGHRRLLPMLSMPPGGRLDVGIHRISVHGVGREQSGVPGPHGGQGHQVLALGH